MNSQSYKESYWWQLMALLLVMLLFRLDAPPVYILDEAKNAQCAREMLQKGEWIVPTFNGIVRTDKPPLHYYFMMAAYSLFGYTAFATRFFSAIMGILTVVITYHYTKKLFNAFTGFCASLVLVCSSHFLFEFRLAVPDPYLIFFITLGLFSGITWLLENNTRQLFMAAVALALATLAKGPVAIFLPGACILSWVILKQQWNIFFTWKLFPALLLYIAIAFPWYYAVYNATNGVWINSFFIEQNLNRFSDPQEGHGGLFILTSLFVLIGLLPFSGFIVELVRRRSLLFRNQLVQFSGIIVIVFVIFFSIASTKLPNYPMPCYPFAAVILGHFIASLLNKETISKTYPFYIVFAVTLIVPIAGFFAIRQEAEAKDISYIALFLLIAPVLFAIYLLLKKGNDWSGNIGFIAFAFSVFNIIGLHYLYPALYSKNPVTKNIDTVKQFHYIYAYHTFNPGFRFYLDKDIPVADNLYQLRHWIDSTPGALVITRAEYTDSLKQISLLHEIARHHDIFEFPTTVILAHEAKP